MMDCWKHAGLPEYMVSVEYNLLFTEPREIWNLLSRLWSRIHRYFVENLYIILDSLDNMYKLIANLTTADGKVLYLKFTKDVSIMINKKNSRIKIFRFGVITEFQSHTIYSIINIENVVGKYFFLGYFNSKCDSWMGTGCFNKANQISCSISVWSKYFH